MRATSPRAGSLISAGLAALVLLATGLVATAQERPDAAAKPGGPTRWIFGERYCAQCHAHPENYMTESVICRMNESLTWGGKDKHKNAFALLSGARGQQIGKLLGIDVATHRSCLSCHGISDRPAGTERDWGPTAAARTQQFDRKGDGVSCVACHGAYREWVLDHSIYEDPRWRGLTRKEKESRYGMVDLWDPVTRTKVCVSCHIGNVQEGKVLTHAMYAAGHPPLPGIEVSTFSAAMPYHWEYLGEKRRGRRPEVVKALEATLDLDRLEHTELVAVSGLVPLRESLRLFAAQAEEGELPDLPGSRWPDFARFDCYACHHDVNRPSWRQARGFAGAPGRPPAPTWPTALVGPGIEAADPRRAKERRGEFDRKLRDLHEALSVQPFGARVRAVAAAGALASWTDELLGELGKTKLDRPAALRMLEGLCRPGPAELPDYDTARQRFWAIRTIYREVEPDAGPESAVSRVLDRLDGELGFSLPSAGVQVPIEDTLVARLKAVAAFDPAIFLERLAEVCPLLPRR